MDGYHDLVLGIDIGGSHITAGLVNMQTHQLIESSYIRSRVDSKAPAKQILACWMNAIEKSFAKTPGIPRKIGIAMPGPFDYANGISYIRGVNKYESLYGLNIRDILAESLKTETDHILLLNDAQSFLQGEVFSRPELRDSSVIGLTLGTGLGSATYKAGVTRDAEMWKYPLFGGIAEEHISTRWFLKYYFEVTGINIMGVKELHAIAQNSPVARAVFKRFAFNLSEFLAEFVKQENPDRIVLAGNISNASRRFLPVLLKLLKKKDIHLPIDVSTLGEYAPLLGAASCFMK